jgi:imidazolonepropionase-like amidohydrolase
MTLMRYIIAGIVAIFAFATLNGEAVAQGPPVNTAAPAQPKIIVYRGATIIDGTGAAPRPNMAIIVRDHLIEAIVPARNASPWPAGAEIVDVSGQFAIPGLIDAHVHLATRPDPAAARAFLRRNLYAGVTAVRDMAGDARLVAELSREALADEIPSPDIAFAAVMVGPDFFEDPRVLASTRGMPLGRAPWMQAITVETDLRLAVARAGGSGATGIKIYGDIPADLVRRIVAEAHRQNMLVWAHGAIFPTRPEEVIASGANVISHSSFVALALAPTLPNHFRDMQTIDMRAIMLGYREDNATLAALFGQMRQNGQILDATVSISARAGQPPGGLTVTAAVTRQAYRAGVAIAAGTDVRNADDAPFPPLHRELELLADEVGMTPSDVIRSATMINAATIGRQAEMGSLAPNKLANIVFLSADPLQDISNLQQVVMTVRRGTRFPRADFGADDRAAAPRQ